jgi:hypothetical protein
MYRPGKRRQPTQADVNEPKLGMTFILAIRFCLDKMYSTTDILFGQIYSSSTLIFMYQCLFHFILISRGIARGYRIVYSNRKAITLP